MQNVIPFVHDILSNLFLRDGRHKLRILITISPFGRTTKHRIKGYIYIYITVKPVLTESDVHCLLSEVVFESTVGPLMGLHA